VQLGDSGSTVVMDWGLIMGDRGMSGGLCQSGRVVWVRLG